MQWEAGFYEIPRWNRNARRNIRLHAPLWNTRRYGVRRRHNSPIRLEGDIMGRGILLWLLGVPIPVIILLALIWH
jgi:hypothetical protein